jgi:UPF0716 protein FxsA
VPVLVLLFVVTQIVEIWLLIQIGQAIGGWQTLLLLILDSLLGAALLRHQGRRTWRAFRLALEQRRVPAKEVADGALVLVGGTLLITPGFLSDVVGVLCLLPPTRALLRPMLTRFVARRLGLPGVVTGPGSPGASPYRSTFIDGEVLDGEVLDGEVLDGEVLDGEVLDGEVVDGEVIDPPTGEGPPPDGRRP